VFYVSLDMIHGIGHDMANSAHIYKSKSGNWNISFHHPICREGTIGKKIHRSLKVSDESDAQALRDEMNTLLVLAETPTLLPARSHAIAEGKYARVIIDAFFDCMTPEPADYLALREREMPLPPRQGKRCNVPRILIVGPTAAGKSRFSQHLLQTTHENFPMRGAGRTTVTDTETIVDDVDYAAVVTFYSENEIRETGSTLTAVKYWYATHVRASGYPPTKISPGRAQR
jgi:hypothetical protein